MCAPSLEAGNSCEAPAWVLYTSRTVSKKCTGNCSQSCPCVPGLPKLKFESSPEAGTWTGPPLRPEEPTRPGIAAPGNSSSVWELVLMRNIRVHWVPLALVVMAACVFWVQHTFRLWAIPADIAMRLSPGIEGVARGMLGVSVVVSLQKLLPSPQRCYSSSSRHPRQFPQAHTTLVRGKLGSGVPQSTDRQH